MEKIRIVDSLDKGIIKRALRHRKDHIPKKGHSISDYAYNVKGEYEGSCMRKQAYDWYEQEPTDLDPKRFYAAFAGDKLHAGFIELLEEDGWEIIPELPLKPFKHPDLEYEIRGRMDAYMKKNTVIVSAEFKTMQGRALTGSHPRSGKGGFDGVKDTGAKPGAISQVSWYRHMLEADEEYENPHHWPVLYFARDNFYRLEFEGGFDFDFIDLPVPYWVILEEYIKKGELPPREYRSDAKKGMKSWVCEWCWYKTICWGLHKNI